MSLWLWISWHTLPVEGLLERAKDEEGEGREGRFLDGQDLPPGSGTEGIGCFDHIQKIGIDVMPHPCGDSPAKPFSQMKCQNGPFDNRSYLLRPCSDTSLLCLFQHNYVLKCLLLFLSFEALINFFTTSYF